MCRLTRVHALCAVVCFAICGATAAVSANLNDLPTQAKFNLGTDAVERLRLVERLPMLTQRVAAASCAVTGGLDIEKHQDVLKASSREFNAIIRALKYGNPNFNVTSAEENRQILNDIDLVSEAWGYTKSAVYGRLSGRDDAANAIVIGSHNKALLSMTNTLAAEIHGHYGHPIDVKQSDAMALSIASRQAQLLQQIALAVCENQAADKELNELVALFDASLLALGGGMASVGLGPAPTEQIADELAALSQRWSAIKARYFLGNNAAKLDSSATQMLLADLNRELHALDHLADHYAAYASRLY